MRGARKATNTEREFARAVELHRAGRIAEAEAAFRDVVRADPRHHRALFGLGLLALQAYRDEQAADWTGRAVALDPENVAYRVNLSEAYRRMGRLPEAAEHLVRAVSLKPDFAEAHHNLGIVRLQAGDDDGGLANLARAVDLKPEHPLFHERLAEALHTRGNLEAAEGHRACANLRAGSPPAPVQGSNPLEAAREARASGRLVDAVARYHEALASDGTRPDPWAELSGVLEALGRVDGAAVAALRALAVDPRCAAAHAALAAARVLQHRYDEAAACCREAIALDPSSWLAHFHLGNSLAARGTVVEAVDAFRRAVGLCPERDAAHSALLFLMPYAPGVDVAAVGREARAWAERRAEPLTAGVRPHANDPGPGRRLRIGYVSPDLRTHPVSLFLHPLLAHHDRRAVEVFCYASVAAPDVTTAHIRERSDHWRDVLRFDDAALADLVRQDRIDVLVDLSMHASGGRPLLFARKPAPVQVCWLAYVGTTGLRAMDYRITDPHLEPPGVDPAWAVEAPLTLPDSFWCYTPWSTVTGAPAHEGGPLPAERSGRITFGSQHSIQKINAGVLGVWAAVLKAVPGSTLLLFAPETAQPSIVAGFEREGIERRRVECRPLRGLGQYLETYRTIDVCLDTFPCNGGTSSMDALWMGVPVVTMAGETPAGRAGLSIAHAVGLPELVARSADEYVATAVGLAHDVPRLRELRAGLRGRMEASPLMDAPRFARNMEAAYRTAWRRWCAR